MMNTDIALLITEAKEWLAQQPAAIPQTDRWYSLGNFKSFIEAIEAQPTEPSIERAVHALRHHIVDQFEWSSDDCKSISNFCERADRIRRAMKNG